MHRIVDVAKDVEHRVHGLLELLCGFVFPRNSLISVGRSQRGVFEKIFEQQLVFRYALNWLQQIRVQR